MARTTPAYGPRETAARAARAEAKLLLSELTIARDWTDRVAYVLTSGEAWRVGHDAVVLRRVLLPHPETGEPDVVTALQLEDTTENEVNLYSDVETAASGLEAAVRRLSRGR
jgi:hypothetical protein